MVKYFYTATSVPVSTGTIVIFFSQYVKPSNRMSLIRNDDDGVQSNINCVNRIIWSIDQISDINLLFGSGQELHSRPSMQETAASFLFGGVSVHESNAFSDALLDSIVWYQLLDYRQ